MKTTFYIFIISIFSFSMLFAKVLYVPEEIPSIQRAIDEVENGDTVLVNEGTYYENINFRGKAITVASLFLIEEDEYFISNTVINGGLPTSKGKSSVVSFTSGEDTNSVLYGFTITGGTGTLVDGGTAKVGGGIVFLNSGGRISYNRIEYNSIQANVPSFGAGIGQRSSKSESPSTKEWFAIVEHNWIQNNTIKGSSFTAGGGIRMSGNARITENKIRDNLVKSYANFSKGGGVYLDGSSGESFQLSKNIIIGNQAVSISKKQRSAMGGGLWVSGYTNSEISGNRIQSNKVRDLRQSFGAGAALFEMDASNTFCGNHVVLNSCGDEKFSKGGGLYLWNSNLCAFNNIISHNRSTFGGGLYLYGEFSESVQSSNAKLINNTVVMNTAFSQGGGLYFDQTDPVVMNTIVWDNSAKSDPGIYAVLGKLDRPKIVYSDIQNWRGGEGNISTDPLFANSLFQLSDASPCLGAGIDTFRLGSMQCFSPSFCIYGRSRPLPLGTMPDMGACEHDQSLSIVNSVNYNTPKGYSLKPSYPNPFNPSTTIEFSIPRNELVTLKIYNLLGQEIATLVSEKLDAGDHKYSWNAGSLAGGVYLYELKVGEFSQSRKLILMK